MSDIAQVIHDLGEQWIHFRYVDLLVKTLFILPAFAGLGWFVYRMVRSLEKL
jgi:hypothetical protein